MPENRLEDVLDIAKDQVAEAIKAPLLPLSALSQPSMAVAATGYPAAISPVPSVYDRTGSSTRKHAGRQYLGWHGSGTLPTRSCTIISITGIRFRGLATVPTILSGSRSDTFPSMTCPVIIAYLEAIASPVGGSN